MVVGPVFISHAAIDGEDTRGLSEGLREAFNGYIRTFNTSTGAAVRPGDSWRDKILQAIEGSSLIILWATDAALASPEVAFEIGAAFAYRKHVIPCCVHIPPSKLLWSLSQKQALFMDQASSWESLAERIAQELNYSNSINHGALQSLAAKIQSPRAPISLRRTGMTMEVRNESRTPVVDNARI